MTNTTPPGQVPEALRPIQRFNNFAGLMKPEYRGLYVRYDDHAAQIAALRTQQPAPAGAPDAETVSLIARARLSMKECVAWEKNREGRPPSQLCIFEIQDAENWMTERGIDVYAPTPQPAPAAGVTVEQVEDAIGLQSTAWDTIGAEKIVEAVLRLTNGQAPATQQAGVPSDSQVWSAMEALSKHDSNSEGMRAALLAGAFAPQPSPTAQAAWRVTAVDDKTTEHAMLEALTSALQEVIATGQSEGVHFGNDPNVDGKLETAITAARARLLDSDLSNLTERGAAAWAGVDAQKLREDGTT